MKKTIWWSLISAGITVLWISVGKFAYAADQQTAPLLHKPAAPVTITQVKPKAEIPTTFTPAQVTQLHEIIRNYLVNNPQVLVEASQTLQAQQEKQMQTAATQEIEKNKTALFDDAQSPSIGNKAGSATLVEFFDYQCGHCRAMASTIEKVVAEDKNLHVVFKELPIFGGMSSYAAKVALAAALQPGKYYAFHNALFSTTSALTKESILGLAKKSGLNMVKLRNDMKSPEIEKQLQSNFALAQALKIMGTPTFVIGNASQTKFAYIPGAISLTDLQEKIKSVQ